MLKTFSTTEIIAREGWKNLAIIFAILLFTCIIDFGYVLVSIILFVTIYMYRNPERIANEDDNQAILSPVDGKIVKIDRTNDELLDNEKGIHVVIRNLPFNVGMVRFPIDGELSDVKTVHGLYIPPFWKLSKKLNERVLMRCKQKGNSFAIKIWAGMFSRKIYLSSSRGNLKKGTRVAFVVDGTVEIFLPLNTRIKLSVGDYVKSGESVLGYFENKDIK